MQLKTPRFDAAIREVLFPLVPHECVCRTCGNSFFIGLEDIQFFELLSVPPAKDCPDCRKRVRRAFANYTTFYKRACSVPVHTEQIISQIPEGAPFPVYDTEYFYSDAWDPGSFGKSFDVSRSFFDQFSDFFRVFPQPQTTRDPMSVNSEYSAYGVQLKNCYYIFGGIFSENILYGNWPAYTKDSVDVLIPWQSERMYEVVYSKSSFACRFAYFSKQCIDCAFIYDCHNCEHCFGCVNLRNKKYSFFNEELGKEEYEKRMHDVRLSSFSNLTMWREKFFAFLRETPKRSVFNERIEKSMGNFLENCRDYYDGFFAMDGEHVRYSEMNLKAKDCMDMLLGTAPSRTYFSVMPYEGSDVRFSVLLRNQCMHIEYSYNLRNCAYCFGCIGLSNKKFCIFNRQYCEDEYWVRLDEIKTAMLLRGEYGDFFPIGMSPFPYNASLAQLSHPRTAEEAKYEGLWWVESAQSSSSIRVLNALETPDDISLVMDEILSLAIMCERTGRLFRITRQELDFYRKEGLALPRLHPQERLLDRLRLMGFSGLTKARCSKCGVAVLVNLSIGEKGSFLCEGCYTIDFV